MNVSPSQAEFSAAGYPSRSPAAHLDPLRLDPLRLDRAAAKSHGYPQFCGPRLLVSTRRRTLGPMRLEEALVRNGGVARRSTLIRAGVRSRELAEAARSGSITLPRRGIYALPGADPVTVASVAWDCHPTCVTAALRIGLPVLKRPSRLHMAFAPARSSGGRHAWPPRSVKVHMSKRLNSQPQFAADVIDASGRCVNPIEQLVMIDGALNRGLMAVEEIESFTFTSRKRSRWLRDNCDTRSQSPLETIVRIALRRAGLRVEPQRVIPGVGRVDFLVEGVVIVETDGRATHAQEAAFSEDRRRDRAAVLVGFVVLRFGYADVMDDLPWLVAQVQAAARLWANAAA